MMLSGINDIKLLKKGERGLFFSDGKRIYFPDRCWEDAKAGYFSDMKITKDKDTYAFITGKMIDDVFIKENSVDICSNLYLVTLTDFFRSNETIRIFDDNSFDFVKEDSRLKEYSIRYVILNTENGYEALSLGSLGEALFNSKSDHVVKTMYLNELSKSVMDAKSCGIYIRNRNYLNDNEMFIEVRVPLGNAVYIVKFFNAGHKEYKKNLTIPEAVEEVQASWKELEDAKRNYCKHGGRLSIQTVSKAAIQNVIFF